MGDSSYGVGKASEGLSSASVNEKGSRNKRKFLSDLSLDMPVDVSALSLTEFPRYEMLEEKFRKALDELASMIEMPDEVIEEQEGEYLLADWDDPIACQLEELLMSNLFTTFCTAVKKIVECGYTDEVATWAVLNSNMFHGSKDAVSNVVDGALALLKREKEFHTPKHSVFEKLQSLVDYTLLEMVHVLREVRPGLTIAEAMWCLMMSDLNLLNACVMEGSRIGASFGQEASEDSTLASELKAAASNSQNSQHETAHTGASNQPSNSKPNPGKLASSVNENSYAHQEAKGTFSSQGIAMDEKTGVSRKGSSSSTGRRDVLRQKAFHFEKNYKGRMSKGTLKAKVAAWGSMMLDKSLKSQSGSSGIVMKGTYTKLTTAAVEDNNNPSSNSQSEVPAGVLAAKDAVIALPAASSKSAAPSTSDPKPSPKGRISVSDTCKTTDYYASIPFDETLQKHTPRDDKDKTILMLVPHKQALEKELQSWTDWANNKVMQAARRLGKDQGELKMLRQEKEETEKFKKEKQTLEESTAKRLSEMEYALTNATGQIEIANSNARRLEEENSVLKKEMEAASLQAMRSATNLHEAMRKSQETMKKLQSWDAEKGLLQEQLTNLKRRAAEFENQLKKARGTKDRFEVLLKQEESEKLKATDLINKLREKKAEDDSSSKAEEERIKQMAEKNRQKCEEDIKTLRNMIAELRLEYDKSQIAALTEGYGNGITSPGLQQSKLSKRLAMFQDNLGGGDVKPERECVMCMTDEISVVFLPCCHQVLCSQCNDLHEKQGMKDCPSCRTSIQKRISVVYRDN